MAHRKSTNNKHIYRTKQRYSEPTREIDTLYTDDCERTYLTILFGLVAGVTLTLFITIIQN
jgi:hypothetical protein